jgi:hypothetical protein
MPDMCGYLGPSSNTVGIQGAWYGYGDCWGTAGGPPGDCENKGMHTVAQCSAITSPAAQTASAGDAGGDAAAACGFPQTTAGTMCLSGTGAKVIGTPPDYSNIFGIGIGLDFNNQNGVKMVWDSTTSHVVGFKFHLTGVPAGGVRIEFPTTQTDAAGSDSWSIMAAADGDFTADLTTSTSDAHHLSPAFTPPAGTMQPPFDPKSLKSIQIHVATNTSAAIPVTNLCISNLVALM